MKAVYAIVMIDILYGPGTMECRDAVTCIQNMNGRTMSGGAKPKRSLEIYSDILTLRPHSDEQSGD